MLSNFQLGDQALLQSFLVGQPELRDTMHGPQMQQLRQRVIASYHLGPMDAGDTRAYIEHRLKHVGWKDDPAISDEAHQAIYAFTGGLPRRINTLCNRLLLAAFLGEQHAIGGGDVDQIAREIGEEIGGGDLSDAPALGPGGSRPPAPTGLGTLSDPRLHRLFEHVDERIDRLERTVAAAVDLLHRLLHPDKPPPGKPEDPARS